MRRCGVLAVGMVGTRMERSFTPLSGTGGTEVGRQRMQGLSSTKQTTWVIARVRVRVRWIGKGICG